MATSGNDYPVSFEVGYPESPSRLLALLGAVFFIKFILLLPHLIIMYFLSIVSFIVSYIGYWAVHHSRPELSTGACSAGRGQARGERGRIRRRPRRPDGRVQLRHPGRRRGLLRGPRTGATGLGRERGRYTHQLRRGRPRSADQGQPGRRRRRQGHRRGGLPGHQRRLLRGGRRAGRGAQHRSEPANRRGQSDRGPGDSRTVRALGPWVATARSDRPPHVVPVWGVWVDERFWFFTDRRSFKARNAERDPRATVNLESGDEVVILEGTLVAVTETGPSRRVSAAYEAKYGVTAAPDDVTALFYLSHRKVAMCSGVGNEIAEGRGLPASTSLSK